MGAFSHGCTRKGTCFSVLCVCSEIDTSESTEVVGSPACNDVVSHYEYRQQCPECGDESFTSNADLCDHLCRTCRNVSLECQLCSEHCVGRNGLSAHVVACHYSEDVVTCPICGQPYTSRESLEKHSRLHLLHLLPAGEGCSRLYSLLCCCCGQHCYSEDQLTGHLLSHQSEDGLTSLLCCAACCQTFNSMHNLEHHLSTHGFLLDMNDSPERFGIAQTSPVYLNVTETSPKLSRDTVQPVAVISHSTSKRFQCEMCDSSFSRASDLQAHVRRHTGELGHRCDLCGREFRKKNTLDRHRRVHTNERPYVCETCGKSFKIMFHLRMHLTVHSNVKSFSCPTCNKCFKNAVRLRKHAFVHTGIKPFTCPICDRAFNRNANMRSHLQTHESKTAVVDLPATAATTVQECSLCSGQYTDLVSHLQTEHGGDILLNALQNSHAGQSSFDSTSLSESLTSLIHTSDSAAGGTGVVFCKVDDPLFAMACNVQFSDDDC